jgi:hypothetical protein
MASIINTFKNELGNAFSTADARRDDEGNQSFGDFYNSVSEESDIDTPKKKKKVENKEATGAAGGSGMFISPLSTKQETKEATGASSAGQYSGPSIWAKSTNKKDWRGKSKPQIPGGKFVTIKKKCKTFPYCNQGDIKALKIYEDTLVKDVISKISKEHNISENVIKSIIQYDIENRKNK